MATLWHQAKFEMFKPRRLLHRFVMLRLSRSFLALALTLLFISCDTPEARVEVALITDAVPGVEFHFVELDLLTRGTGAPQLVRSARVQVATGDVFRTARTMTRFLPITPGSYSLDARLAARDGVRPVLSRHLDVEVREDMRIVIRLDRACITVECPGSGDAGSTECVGGRCEDPTCASSPLSCPTHTGCTSAADCPRASTCAASECVDGVCFNFPNPGACPETSYCDLARGCIPYSGGDVCGMPCTLGECGVGRWSCATDGMMTCEPFLTRPPGEPCGDGVCDGTGACEACVADAPCDTGNPCEVGRIDCSTGHQVCVGQGPRPSGTECRAAAGVCDTAEVCDGTSVVCPSDAHVSAGTECRASAGDCDVAEVCDGMTANCPSDAVRTSDYVCRASAGACDTDELCDGTSTMCPADARATAGTTCRAAAGDCDSIEICDGTSAACPSDSLRSSGSVCRAAASSCDVQEVCSGTSDTCPIDSFVSIGSACAAGFCNGMGMCLDTCTPGAACSTGNPCELGRTDCSSGVPVCMAMGPGNAGALCRPAAGPCDVADVCSGTSTVCGDLRAPATVVCRPAVVGAAGGCDRAEMCNGTAITCPADTFLPATTTCRAAAAGGCDVAETCSGTTAACPADRFAAATVVCRMSGGFCDVAETCTGSAAACPANTFQPASLQCRAAAGVCDQAESCTGSAALCPTDALLGPTTTCRAAVVGGCDVAEVCSGTVSSCPANGFQPSGTACPIGQCDTTGVCAIEQDCTHRWRVATSYRAGTSTNMFASLTTVVAGGLKTAGSGADGYSETTGAVVWTQSGVGSFAAGASSRYALFQTTGGGAAGYVAYDMVTGAMRTGFNHIFNTAPGWGYGRMGVDEAGTSFIASHFAASGAPTWSITATGNPMPITGPAPAGLFVQHAMSGNYVTHQQPSTSSTPLDFYAMPDGRWAVLARSAASAQTFGTHIVPAGTSELVILTSTFAFDRAHSIPFGGGGVTVAISSTGLRVVSDTAQTYAFTDAGLAWMRADCGGFYLGASATQVFLASGNGSSTFCGRPMPAGSGSREGRIAVLNATTGATVSTRWFPFDQSPSAGAISPDGDVYFLLPAASTVCGTLYPSQTLVAF